MFLRAVDYYLLRVHLNRPILAGVNVNNGIISPSAVGERLSQRFDTSQRESLHNSCGLTSRYW